VAPLISNSENEHTASGAHRNSQPDIGIALQWLLGLTVIFLVSLLSLLLCLPDGDKLEQQALRLYEHDNRDWRTEPLLLLSIVWDKVVLAPDDRTLARSYRSLAEIYLAKGESDKFESTERKALALLQDVQKRERESLAYSYLNARELIDVLSTLTEYYLKTGRTSEAKLMLNQAKEIYHQKRQQVSEEQMITLLKQASRLRQLLSGTVLKVPELTPRWKKKKLAFQALMTAKYKGLPESAVAQFAATAHWHFLLDQVNQYERMNRFPEATQTLEEMVATVKTAGVSPLLTELSLLRLGFLHQLQSDYPRAASDYEQVIGMRSSINGNNAVYRAFALEADADLAKQIGQHQRAASRLEDAFKLIDLWQERRSARRQS
jgi:tetratricopeptide (TPR) repeat protein